MIGARGKLQAFYTLQELADLAGTTRWRVRRLLEANGVEISQSGRLRVVYLSALKRALPDLWESILDRQAANDAVEE